MLALCIDRLDALSISGSESNAIRCLELACRATQRQKQSVSCGGNLSVEGDVLARHPAYLLH
jgi:hypothetical protein